MVILVGCRFTSMLDTQDVTSVAQILGSAELLPLILDLIQLLEMKRIRIGDKDPSRFFQPSHDFWKSLTGFGTQFSAKEMQCLRNTIPQEAVGKERYDAATLFEYMIERSAYCRSKWGMKELPDDYLQWWKVVYQSACLECCDRKTGASIVR